VAQQLNARGALWNTMVTCASVDALWELGRATEPQLLDILDSLVPLVGTPDEEEAIEHIYRAFLPVSFSRDMLEARAGAPRGARDAGRGVERLGSGPSGSRPCSRCARSRALVPARVFAP